MHLLVASVAFCLVFVASVSSRCPPGAVQGIFDRECYVFGKTPTTWMEAEKACSTLNGHLTSVSGFLTNAFLATSAVPCLGDYWHGGFKGFDLKFKWSWTDGRRFRFSNWAAGNADVVMGCLSMDPNTAKWHSSACDAKKAYVCSVPAVRRAAPTKRPEPVTNAPPNYVTCKPFNGRICPA